ncbi:CU044_5270 family protein [Streptomyces sp. sk226]|uniref:CU044_5270 family protein n=1 Tax=Streptomyces sp. sk226 TaxID=2034268 RepID=UPI000BF1701E|nr:CU044_5270 family protein [Streptomyces sp. sk226]
MNATPYRPAQAEREETARLLPAPAERDLPPGRHLHHKELLMRQIDEDTTRASHQPGGLRRRLVDATAPGRPRRRLVLGASLAAGAMAAVIAVTAVGSHAPTTVPQAASAPGGSVSERGPGGASPQAVQLLTRIAAVAAGTSAPQVRDDQYIYIASQVYGASKKIGADGDGAKAQYNDDGTGATQPRQAWFSVNGSRDGLLNPGLGSGEGDVNLGKNTEPSLQLPTYTYLASLPTDPDALLTAVYAQNTGVDKNLNPDQEAFQTIGDALRESLMPPQIGAALYKAAAKIPGVNVVDDAVDASGRHGVAVSQDHGNQRTEWIFDKDKLTYLGERTVLINDDSAGGKTGRIIVSTAVTERAVVDKAGQKPSPGTAT